MLEHINHVDFVEMLRDGGSLCAGFTGTNGSRYRLLFKVRLRIPATGVWERLGYFAPVVGEATTWQGTQISWEHAQVLLNQIRALTDDPKHIEWLTAMCEVVSTRGALPSAVQRFL
jgi:hypothetical protein